MSWVDLGNYKKDHRAGTITSSSEPQKQYGHAPRKRKRQA
ncbi:hypothetical protein NGA_0446500 [Nannochloropsis gaditana CCMP526]|nr:hypothetical protein NGA_0446500 [Nannochloropsis gaditana CCMP526]EKU22598.1 hypothetical protein NGA_0446500 [Nannochloropsis gaditana CCMP526]|eukprot:XP_005853762.1 hypothetical protein NGA_0446500 [Nannochloropsis gaditana CCMP526]